MNKLVASTKMYSQFALGLRRFLKNPPTAESALRAVRDNMEHRDRNFIRILTHGIYANPGSPYRKLLEHAGLNLRDVTALVNEHGLDKTLRILKDAGVYVTFEEFKGRVPIERPGLKVDVTDKDFDNPRLRAYYEGQTSGSTGAGTRVAMDLDHMKAMLDHLMVYMQAVKQLDVPMAVWFPVLPATTGLSSLLIGLALGLRMEKWFTPVTSQNMNIPVKYRLATQYARAMTRLFGLRIPSPEPVSILEARRIAEWARDRIRENGSCIIVSYVSLNVRIALAAKEVGIDLKGCRFVGTGEPATPAKVRAIRSSGAFSMSSYGFSEGGLVAMSCRNPASENDLHVFRDAWSVLQTPVEVPGSSLVVDAFSFTGLLASLPKIMLNVELDDYGVLDQRDCGCPLQGFGFPDHISDIYSFRKLTGEGMTLVGSTMLRVLEEVLPAQFGGTALDYQLVEEEDDAGFTRLTIVVSPTVGTIDETALINCVLDEVSRDSPGADLARVIWRDAGTLRVRREDPTWSTLGKLLSLRPAKRNVGIVFQEEAGVG